MYRKKKRGLLVVGAGLWKRDLRWKGWERNVAGGGGEKRETSRKEFSINPFCKKKNWEIIRLWFRDSDSNGNRVKKSGGKYYMECRAKNKIIRGKKSRIDTLNTKERGFAKKKRRGQVPTTFWER